MYLFTLTSVHSDTTLYLILHHPILPIIALSFYFPYSKTQTWNPVLAQMADTFCNFCVFGHFPVSPSGSGYTQVSDWFSLSLFYTNFVSNLPIFDNDLYPYVISVCNEYLQMDNNLSSLIFSTALFVHRSAKTCS